MCSKLNYKCVCSVVLIPCENIDPNPLYCRKNYNSDNFDEFLLSVKNNGIIQPLLVKKKADRFQIVSGERRLRAAILCNMIYVPCIIINIPDDKIADVSIIDNIQRENIHFFDEAQSFIEVMKKFNITTEHLSCLIGKTEEYINNKIKLLEIDTNLRKIIIDNSLSEECAIALLKINDKSEQIRFLDEFINYNIYNQIYFCDAADSIKNRIVLKFNNIKLFINTFNHTVDTMQKAGINVISEQYESDNFLEYIVRIPKIATSPVIFD